MKWRHIYLYKLTHTHHRASTSLHTFCHRLTKWNQCYGIFQHFFFPSLLGLHFAFISRFFFLLDAKKKIILFSAIFVYVIGENDMEWCVYHNFIESLEKSTQWIKSIFNGKCSMEKEKSVLALSLNIYLKWLPIWQ